jgi:hypothetical protein
MIREQHGVAIAHQRSWADFGVEEVACEVRWLTKPGWLTLQVEAPMQLQSEARSARGTPDSGPLDFGTRCSEPSPPAADLAVSGPE